MDHKRRRAINFKADELKVLLASVEKSKDVLFGKSTPMLTHEKKDREWAKIAENVSAVSGIQRTVDAVKKKFSTYTSETKMKAALNAKEIHKTGGGIGVPSLTPPETRIAVLIGNYEGIPGGCGVGLAVDTPPDTIKWEYLEDNRVILDQSRSMPTPPPADVVASTSTSTWTQPPEKKLKPSTLSPDTQALLEIEERKLEVCRERLAIETERLMLEKEIEEKNLELYRERLAIERERLMLEKEKFEFEKQKKLLCRKCNNDV